VHKFGNKIEFKLFVIFSLSNGKAVYHLRQM